MEDRCNSSDKDRKFKTIKIPHDINDLADYHYYTKAAEHVNSLKSQLDTFAERFIDTHFLFSGKQLLKNLSDVDREHVANYYLIFKSKFNQAWTEKEILKIFKNDWFFFDSKKKKIYPYNTDSRTTTMGETRGRNKWYEFSKDGKELVLYQSWETKTARFDHIPWIKHTEKCLFDLEKIEIKYIWKDQSSN